MGGFRDGLEYVVVTSLFVNHQYVIVTSALGIPCTGQTLQNNSTTVSCIQTEPNLYTTAPEDEPNYPGSFITTPYIFAILCGLIFLPFVVLLKVWWVRRIQHSHQQFQNVRRANSDNGGENPDICVIDPAMFAPPPSYDEVMSLPPPYDYLPAYKDLKFGPNKQSDSLDEPSTSSGISFPLQVTHI